MQIRSITVLVALAASASALRAQGGPDPLKLADSLRKEIEISALTADGPRLAAAYRLADRAVVLFPEDGLLLHYRAYALYRRTTLESPDPEQKAKLLEDASLTLESSARLKPLAESHALRWSVLGQSISDQRSAMAIGPILEMELAAARRLGPRNPRVAILQGMSAFFAPEMWGGGADRALEHLTRARILFKDDKPAVGLPAWGRAETEAWIGIVHQKQGRNDEARRAFDEALRMEPGFVWVSRVLIPGWAKGVLPFP